MQILTVKIPAGLERDLDRAAEERGVSKSQLAREAIAVYIRRPAVKGKPAKSALTLAGDLAGRIRRGPRDLATNPRYMSDYGKD